MKDTRNIIFLRNVPYHASIVDVTDFVSQFGTVSSVRIPFDSTMQRPKGFAFVTCPTEAAAANLLRAIHKQYFMGRPLSAELANAPPREARRA
jgi:RNA recognition motif-containing protein